MSFIKSLKGKFITEKPSIVELYQKETDRAKAFSVSHQGLELDFSRQAVSQDSFNESIALLEATELKSAIQALMAGEKVNNTEDRAALHTGLRSSQPCEEVVACKTKMASIVERIHNKQWLGYSGKVINQIVSIGIGGSDLGPCMAVEALSDNINPEVEVHFVANIDTRLEQVLKNVDPETTLFIVSSKSWTTIETKSNAKRALAWLEKSGATKAQAAKHCIAVTSKPQAALDDGIPEDQILPMWDWVGGRFSMWSAVGLSIALATSFDCFEELLAGAASIDEHYQTASFDNNIPVILSLLEIIHTNIYGAESQAVIPYTCKLGLFTNHLQQMIMESNGKCVDKSGKPVEHKTSPVIWGNAGTIGQHSYHQLLHQGKLDIPVDFILPIKDNSIALETQHQLIANCLAQAQVLVEGVQYEGDDPLLKHKNMPGNRSCNIISIPEVNAFYVGALTAIYEHKVYTSSVLWGINAFDQWGVELGKVLAKDIFASLQSNNKAHKNSATAAFLNRHF